MSRLKEVLAKAELDLEMTFSGIFDFDDDTSFLSESGAERDPAFDGKAVTTESFADVDELFDAKNPLFGS